jgi:hypothetical protein
VTVKLCNGPSADSGIPPAGMTVQNVSVTGQGVLIGVAGTNTSFSQ